MIKLEELLRRINAHNKVRIVVKGGGCVNNCIADKTLIDGNLNDLTWCEAKEYLTYKVVKISAEDNGTLCIVVDF